VQHFAEIFPGWSIYDDPNGAVTGSASSSRPIGRQYKTKAGIMDILCKDTEGNFVVIELKRDKAPDKVVAQVDGYMEWVERNLAQSGQDVHGLIVARSLDSRLQHMLPRRPDIEVRLYDWRLELNEWTNEQGPSQ